LTLLQGAQSAFEAHRFYIIIWCFISRCMRQGGGGN